MKEKNNNIKIIVLPVYNPYTDTWLIQLEDDDFKEISNEEYEKLYHFKTRYDEEKSDE